MRRLLLSSVAALAALSTISSDAFAQDLSAPPPIQQGGPGAPLPNNEQLQMQDTTRRLDEAESQDSKRNFELIWADAQLGGSYIDLAQISSSDFALRKTSSGGPSFGVGAGVRFLVFYAGARARYNVLKMFDLWQLNAEAGLKIPISALDFMAGVHGGYSFVGRLGDSNRALATSVPASNDDVSIRGFNVGVDVAVDYYINSLFSVGVGALGDFLFLSRPEVDLPKNLSADQQASAKNDPVYQKSGSSVGLGLGGFLRAGVHFGL